MIDNLYWWLSILGSLASLIGFPVALWQIYKTRRIAEAAKDASIQTQKAISRNLLLSDISICVRHIQETKSFISNEEYKLAQILNDLTAHLIQIQEILKSSNQQHQIDFQNIFSELKKIRNRIGKKLTENSVKINKAQINSRLDIISDGLNKIIGEIKIFIDKGE